VYDFGGDGGFRWWSGDQGVFNNSGTVRKSAGTDLSSMSEGGSAILFNNAAAGVIEVQTGTLMLNGGGSSAGGTFIVALNAVLGFDGGTHALAGTYTGSGAGTVRLATTIAGDDTTNFNFPAGVPNGISVELSITRVRSSKQVMTA
jgi:hypothetical protein